MSYLTYCTCGSSTHNIAEISKSWFLIHIYLAAWNNGCSRFRGRTKGILFICWLIINKLQPNLHSWDTCLGPEGVPWIEVPLYDGRIVSLLIFCWIFIKQTAATASKAWYDQDCQFLGKANFPSASKHSAKGKNCYTLNWYFMGKIFLFCISWYREGQVMSQFHFSQFQTKC